MATMDNLFSGISGKPTPLFAFNTIIDTDMSLIKYIVKEFKDNPVFDFNKVYSMKYIEIVSEMYKRKYENPLYFFMKDEKDKDLLDKCYVEFLTDHEKEILKYAVGTDIYKLIITYKESGDIVPYILYYSDAEKEFLDDVEEFKNINKISLSEATAIKYSKQITQYFFRYINDVLPFIEFTDKTYYFSTCGLNLVEENDDLNISMDIVKKIASTRSNINVYDMYKTEIIGKYN